jgi:hypothetical protein
MCGFGIWYLALREEHVLKVSEFMLEVNISTKRQEVTGDWRKLNDELHNSYFPQNILR